MKQTTKTKQKTWEYVDKFTKTKRRQEKQEITPQRVTVSFKEKVLFQGPQTEQLAVQK